MAVSIGRTGARATAVPTLPSTIIAAAAATTPRAPHSTTAIIATSGRLDSSAEHAAPANEAPFRVIDDDVEFGVGVVVYSFTNLYGCRIGDGTRVGPFVEIQQGARV